MAVMREDPPVIFLHQHGIVWGASQKVQNLVPRYDTSTPVEELTKLK
jgi:hypothetical protein